MKQWAQRTDPTKVAARRPMSGVKTKEKEKKKKKKKKKKTKKKKKAQSMHSDGKRRPADGQVVAAKVITSHALELGKKKKLFSA